MQVLILNGSPRKGGNTQVALGEMKKIFDENGVSYTQLDVGMQNIRGCIACNQCGKLGKCVFDDGVNQAARLLSQADGVVVASPVYYASANGTASTNHAAFHGLAYQQV